MSLFATIRQHQAAWARRVLALFAVVWLNMVLQPCAMALGGDQSHDCLHCPPAHAAAPAEHSGHTDHGSHGGHDSASMEMPCHGAVADCSDFDAYSFDGRTIKVKDSLADLPAAIAPSVSSVDSLANISPCQFQPGALILPPGDPPPLHVLYCVYLD